MRRSRDPHPQALERVRGELIEPDVPVARPVAPRRRAPVEPYGPESARVEVVHRHVYDTPSAPAAAPAPPAPQRRVPMWMIVLGYFAGIVGVVLLILALSSGPIIQPPHTPTKAHHERTTR
jgi:hypothetical protein